MKLLVIDWWSIATFSCWMYWVGYFLPNVITFFTRIYMKNISWRGKKGTLTKNFLDFYFSCPESSLHPGSIMSIEDIDIRVLQYFNYELSPMDTFAESLNTLIYKDHYSAETIKMMCDLNDIQTRAYIIKWFIEEYKIPKHVKFKWWKRTSNGGIKIIKLW